MFRIQCHIIILIYFIYNPFKETIVILEQLLMFRLLIVSEVSRLQKSDSMTYMGVLVGRFPISGGACGPGSPQPIWKGI